MTSKITPLLILVTVMVLATSLSFGQVKINEVVYDTVGTDSAEYIELYGPGGTDISGWQVKLVNGAGGAVYLTITIPGSTFIPGDGFFVIGRVAAGVPNVDYDFNLDNAIQNGAPDAVRLEDGSSVLQDMLVYEGDVLTSLVGDTSGEGSAGRANSPGTTATDVGGFSRIPDGFDSGANKRDFFNAPQTPGTTNILSELTTTSPVVDNFDGGEISSWVAGFTDPKTHSNAFLGIPASTQGGDVLFVQDSTGGGEEYTIPFGNNLVDPTITGEIYIPAADAGFPQQQYGLGFCVGNAINWFSTAAGNGMEDGYYLVYENSSATTGVQGIFGLHAGQAGLYHVVATPGAGTATYRVATLLGSLATPAAGAWTTFSFSIGAGNILCTVGSETCYNGVVPVGGPNSGSFSVGYREFSTGNPLDTNGNQGTVIDAISISGTLVVPVELSEFKSE